MMTRSESSVIVPKSLTDQLLDAIDNKNRGQRSSALVEEPSLKSEKIKILAAALLASAALLPTISNGLMSMSEAARDTAIQRAEYTQVLEIARHYQGPAPQTAEMRDGVLVIRPSEFKEGFRGEENSYTFDATSGRLTVDFNNFKNSGVQRTYEINVNTGAMVMPSQNRIQ